MVSTPIRMHGLRLKVLHCQFQPGTRTLRDPFLVCSCAYIADTVCAHRLWAVPTLQDCSHGGDPGPVCVRVCKASGALCCCASLHFKTSLCASCLGSLWQGSRVQLKCGCMHAMLHEAALLQCGRMHARHYEAALLQCGRMHAIIMKQHCCSAATCLQGIMKQHCSSAAACMQGFVKQHCCSLWQGSRVQLQCGYMLARLYEADCCDVARPTLGAACGARQLL